MKKFSVLVVIAILSFYYGVSSANCWYEGPSWARFEVCDSEKPVEDIKRETSKALRTVRDYLQRGLMPPVVREYFTYLEHQGDSRWKALPPRLRAILAPEYRRAPLSNVRYAENINTIHGQAITVGNKIYFPTTIRLNNYSDIAWLLHELEHVSQYNVHGGETSFIVKYLANGALAIGRNGSINIHDAINLEQDAENKSNRILEKVWSQWTQSTASCSSSFLRSMFSSNSDFDRYMTKPRNATWWCNKNKPSPTPGSRCAKVKSTCGYNWDAYPK